MAAPPAFDLYLLLIPAAAFALSRRFSPAADAWWKSALRCVALFALGVAAASPFLTRRAVGSGEAYNYSLAVDDAITQMRQGVLPPLVGQTEYAFNGRIHPLRNAPYLFYLARALDLATAEKLSAWELQNLSVAFSLVLVFFAAYGGLRWGTECPRPMALLFAAAYGLSSAVLAASYSANLFMTVHAAPFVALALGACFRQCRHPFRLPDLILAAALAGAWLAHPPVAYWLTVSAAAIRGCLFLRYPTWRGFRGLAAAGALFLALAGFVFASVSSMSATGGFFGEIPDFGAAVMPILRDACPRCLLPLAPAQVPASVGDFQLGYLGWALLAALAAILVRPPPPLRRKPRFHCALLASVAAAGFLLALTLPVPGLTHWLWNRLPESAQNVTNIWPMQRIYLVALAVILYAAALILPRFGLESAGARRTALKRGACAAGIVAACWIGWEARPLIGRGMLMRWTETDTGRSHLSSNIDLTVTSYAYLQTPGSYMHGVMDPWFEFRLLRGGEEPIDTPMDDALRTSPVVARGSFRVARRPGAAPVLNTQTVTLLPGRRYLLQFAFHTGPFKGAVHLLGATLVRSYGLPSAGNPAAFGMEPGNRKCLSVWTADREPERVDITLAVDQWPSPPAEGVCFADFTLQEVDPRTLGIRLESLLPLRFRVEAPEEGDFVETPRRYLPGYQARVIGRTVAPLISPWKAVMVPVPKGTSEVELRYPGPPIVVASFWVSGCAWLGFVGWAGARTLGKRPGRLVLEGARRLGAWTARRRGPILVGAGVLAAAAIAVALRAAREATLAEIGPLRVTFLVPFHRQGHTEPIVATGKTGAGTTVYLRYLEGNRVRIGADIWGGAWETEPIALNYFQQQNLVLDASGLYPADNPRLAALPPNERARLRGEFRLELNGRTVLKLARFAYDGTASEVVVGRNAIGSSVAEAAFSGEILNVRRLPIRRHLALGGGQQLQLAVRFPAGHLGRTEPILSLGPEGRDGVCCVKYLSEDGLQFEVLSKDGRVWETAEETVDRAREHRFAFSLGRRAAGGPPAVSWQLDGLRIAGPADPQPLPQPVAVETGFAAEPPPGVDDRFTGSQLEPSEDAAETPADRRWGPVRMVLLFPQGRAGAREPLVTTGVSGRGDFVYVAYADKRHVRFGYDHWGVAGGESGPIAIDYAVPHDVVVSLGSLYPEGAAPGWGPADEGERRLLKSFASVRLDGREVFRARTPAWPSEPEQVTVGLNLIQGSSCGPAFTGLIYSTERLGPAGR